MPECDLPQRFLPSHNSSNPFVTSAHSGSEDLRRRWLEDKAIKECGWPPHVVKECSTELAQVDDWAHFVRVLNCRLLGEALNPSELNHSSAGNTECLDEDELEGLGAHFDDGSQLIIPLPFAPIQLNIIVGADRTLAMSGNPPPMYVTSTTVPAYVRLHLLSKLLRTFEDGVLIETGETVVMACVRLLEEEWAQVEDNGPPEISVVLQHMLPQRTTPSGASEAEPDFAPYKRSSAMTSKVRNRTRKDERSDREVLRELEVSRQSEKYSIILAARKALPAYSFREGFLAALEKNRCIVVVGETGTLI